MKASWRQFWAIRQHLTVYYMSYVPLARFQRQIESGFKLTIVFIYWPWRRWMISMKWSIQHAQGRWHPKALTSRKSWSLAQPPFTAAFYTLPTYCSVLQRSCQKERGIKVQRGQWGREQCCSRDGQHIEKKHAKSKPRYSRNSYMTWINCKGFQTSKLHSRKTYVHRQLGFEARGLGNADTGKATPGVIFTSVLSVFH